MKKLLRTKPNLAIIGIIATSLIVHGWAISPRNAYTMDDFDYIYMAKFLAPKLTLLPTYAYNDRPIRDIFNSLLFWVFGNQYQIQHFILLLIHTVSAILLYCLLKRIINKFKGDSDIYIRTIPLLSALIFAGRPKNFAVFWISASNDLLLVFFFLIISNIYYYDFRKNKNKLLGWIFIIFFFWLSLRTKESAVFIPGILIMANFAIDSYKNRGDKILRLIKRSVTKIDLILLSISGIFLVRLYLLQSSQKMLSDPSGFYYYSRNPIDIILKLQNYAVMFFNFNSDFMTGKPIGNQLFVIQFILYVFLFTAVLYATRNNFVPILLIAMFVLSIFTVLPLINMQHSLYLYFPSIFLSIFLAGTVSTFLFLGRTKQKYLYLAPLLVSSVLIISSSASSIINFRVFWETYSQRDKKIMSDLMGMDKPEDNTVFYIYHVPENHHMFHSLNRNIINIAFDNTTLSVVINPEQTAKIQTPYRLLDFQYEKGHIYEFKDN
jgi:hypothetical protein